jgi:hypothetical protein
VGFRGIGAGDLSFARFITFGVIGAVFCAFYYPLQTFDITMFLYGFGGSTLLLFAKLFLSMAFKTG